MWWGNQPHQCCLFWCLEKHTTINGIIFVELSKTLNSAVLASNVRIPAWFLF